MYVYGNPSGRAREPALIRANWESDIDEVILEPCEQDEDPSGYRVIFYKDPMGKYGKNEDSYSIGASYLRSRLEKLRRAGFDAPMTKKAMTMVNRTKYVHITQNKT